MIIDSIANKRKILSKFLEICVFEGWGDEAVRKAVIECGFEEKWANLIFENGAMDIADFFIKENDRLMVEKLQKFEDWFVVVGRGFAFLAKG